MIGLNFVGYLVCNLGIILSVYINYFSYVIYVYVYVFSPSGLTEFP
jgi:hypothetical protein